MIRRTLSHSDRLIVARALGDLSAENIVAFKGEIRASGHSSYRLIFDISCSKMPLDERSVLTLALRLAGGKFDPTLGPAAIVAGAHSSYVAMLFSQLLLKSRNVRVFRTVEQARRWLLERAPEKKSFFACQAWLGGEA